MGSGRTVVWVGDISQYHLSAYKAKWGAHLQISLFALLADCRIPLYCLYSLLDFSLKKKQPTFSSLLREGQVVFFTPNPFWSTHF